MDRKLSLTEQLRLFTGDDREMAEAVLREVLPKLHQVAARELRRERFVAPLSPTELINEVWLRSLGKGGWQINSREHFYSIAGLAMRRVLVDFARNRLAQRRGSGDVPAALDDCLQKEQPDSSNPETVAMIGELMGRLEKEMPESARVVDMHYFAGFSLEEIAEITGMTLRQIRHRWKKGQDWLKDRLGP